MKMKLAFSLFSTGVAAIMGAWFFASGKPQQTWSALFIFSAISLLVSVVYLVLYQGIGRRNG